MFEFGGMRQNKATNFLAAVAIENFFINGKNGNFIEKKRGKWQILNETNERSDEKEGPAAK